jgi:hypothetical protein
MLLLLLPSKQMHTMRAGWVPRSILSFLLNVFLKNILSTSARSYTEPVGLADG